MCFYLTSGRPVEAVNTPVGGRYPMTASLTKQSHRRAVRMGDYGQIIDSEWSFWFFALPTIISCVVKCLEWTIILQTHLCAACMQH